MKLNKHNLAIFALITANIIWGAASPIFKLALQNIPPFTLAYLRFFGAALLLLPFVYKELSVKRKDWKNLFILSFFGITINITFFFLGIEKAPSINAPVIASAAPIFILIGSILFLKEKPHTKVMIGMFISLVGILIIIGKPFLENQDGLAFVGNLFLVIAAIGSVIHALVSKEIADKYNPLTITFWAFVIASFSFLPMFIYESQQVNWLIRLDYRGVSGIIFGIIFSSTIAYAAYQWGLKQIEAQEVGLFFYIDPIAALILAIPLLGEYPTPLFFLGSALIFIGLFISEGRLHWHPIHKLKIKD